MSGQAGLFDLGKRPATLSKAGDDTADAAMSVADKAALPLANLAGRFLVTERNVGGEQ